MALLVVTHPPFWALGSEATSPQAQVEGCKLASASGDKRTMQRLAHMYGFPVTSWSVPEQVGCPMPEYALMLHHCSCAYKSIKSCVHILPMCLGVILLKPPTTNPLLGCAKISA